MTLQKLEGLLQRLIREAAAGRAFLAICCGLAAGGTLTAAYPVTAVIVPAALLLPRRWIGIALAATLGSALGATLLVLLLHHWGWSQIYERFPQLATHANWARIIDWVGGHGVLALFLIAASPLPQTPALIFFAVARHDYLGVFLAMAAGKAIKYGLFSWAAAAFPERFANGIGGFVRRKPSPGNPP